MSRKIRAILNKISELNFDKLATQLLGEETGISKPLHIEILVREIFDKVAIHHSYDKLYTKLCLRVSEWSIGEGRQLLKEKADACIEVSNLPAPAEKLDLNHELVLYFEKFGVIEKIESPVGGSSARITYADWGSVIAAVQHPRHHIWHPGLLVEFYPPGQVEEAHSVLFVVE